MRKSKKLKSQDIMHISGPISSWRVIEFVQGLYVHKKIGFSLFLEGYSKESNQNQMQ